MMELVVSIFQRPETGTKTSNYSLTIDAPTHKDAAIKPQLKLAPYINSNSNNQAKQGSNSTQYIITQDIQHKYTKDDETFHTTPGIVPLGGLSYRVDNSNTQYAQIRLWKT